MAALPRRTAAHPLHAGFTNRPGASFSDAAMRPNPGPQAARGEYADDAESKKAEVGHGMKSASFPPAHGPPKRNGKLSRGVSVPPAPALLASPASHSHPRTLIIRRL